MSFRFSPSCNCCDQTFCGNNCTTDEGNFEVIIPVTASCCSELEGTYYFTDWTETVNVCESYIDIDACSGSFDRLTLRLEYIFGNTVISLIARATGPSNNLTWSTSVSGNPIDCTVKRNLSGFCNTATVQAI